MKFKMFSVIVGTECCIASCPFCVSGVKPNKENLIERVVKTLFYFTVLHWKFHVESILNIFIISYS